MQVPLLFSDKFNNSDIYSPLAPDYIERIYIYKYYGLADIMSGIGGLKAFVDPIMNSMKPYFVIWFLYQLAKILWFKYEQAFHKESVSFLKYSKSLLRKRVVDQESEEFKTTISMIDTFVKHELQETGKLGDNAYNENTDKDGADEDLENDEKDINELEKIIQKITQLLE